MPRVLIDTNLLVRMVTGTSTISPLYQLWQAGRFELFISPHLLDELTEVLDRPRLRRYLRPGATQAFLTLLRAEATVIIPTFHITLCRDPKDDILLEVAATGRADYLVSADLDLIDDLQLKTTMKAQYGVKVVTMPEFITALKGQRVSH
jgi:putative PIN family toxin of toxin-antitoxin system